MFKVAVIVGSNRRESLQMQLAQALSKPGADRFAFGFVQIDALPLYNQDPQACRRASPGSNRRLRPDGLLFVTAEHNRSIPSVMRNAIEARPYRQNS